MSELHATPDSVLDLLSAIPDPEIPVVTLADLGILREVHNDATGHWTVTITPTYSGCPAMKAIEQTIIATMESMGLPVRVTLVLEPAWTTDWITEEGREKLKKYGIAPPTPNKKSSIQPLANADSGLGVAMFVQRQVNCPRCESADTQRISSFGATACKEPWRCLQCHEPFEHFKCH